MSLILYCAVVVLGVGYVWAKWKHGYWRRKGVQELQPTFLIGNIGAMLMQKQSIGVTFRDIYFKTKQHPHVGTFMMVRPTWVVNDLDLIRTIVVKDFIHFSDHSFQFNEEVEPLAAHLFNLGGEKWKNLRMKLSPTFTTSKIKYMFSTVEQCSREMQTYLGLQQDERALQQYDVKDLLAKFNTDVIGSCAFGIECNSFKNPDAIFRKMGRKLFDPGFISIFFQLLTFFMPNVMNYVMWKIGVSFLGKEVNDFFYKTVDDTIKYREENNVVRNDFMQLLIQLKRDGFVADDESEKETQQDDGTRLTTMQIAAQVFVFFIAGFETSSTTASFALYELALNPDIQDELRKEIDEVLEKHQGNVTYDALGEMTYLGLVIDETLRKYPPLPVLFRICTKEYVIPGTDITIEKDTPVMIPILGIQRDPDIYPNPDKFDPERFTPENKASRHHFSYMPFGEGPRICIGSRFGLMQTKLGLVSILSKYRVSVCDKTLIPMKYDNKSFILSADGGVWLKLTPRGEPVPS